MLRGYGFERIPTRYRANYTNTIGAVWAKNAVATAEVEAINFETIHQLPNNRADIIIADDVEIQRNSETEDQRDKLRGLTTEFGKILKPLDDAEIIYLGTPQTQDSIYGSLPGRRRQSRHLPNDPYDGGSRRLETR